MSKQQVRQVTRATRPSGWSSLWIFAIPTGLALLVWFCTGWFVSNFILDSPADFLNILILVGLQVLLVVASERSFESLPIGHGWHYRLAFFLPLAITLYFFLRSLSDPLRGMDFVWLPVTFVGAFTGGLVSTGLTWSLWENNSPPSPHIQEEVFQRHLAVIGVPAPVAPAKRVFDLLLALAGLLVFSPVWFLTAFLVWFEDPGPLLFVKNSVGRGGLNFHQYKFRTMVRGAETHTGPVLASEADERVLLIGRLVRKTALDELPQLINILKGEMSFVGPRPQRTVLVHGYLEKIPQYAERHRVQPGLSGLAQVAGDYYLTPRQKLRFDCLYIHHSSLGFDLKLVYLAFLITFWYRWRRGWNGRLPRRSLHPLPHRTHPSAERLAS